MSVLQWIGVGWIATAIVVASILAVECRRPTTKTDEWCSRVDNELNEQGQTKLPT